MHRRKSCPRFVDLQLALEELHATMPQVSTERFVLPEDQPQRASARVDAAIAALHDNSTSAASALVDALAENEDRSFYQARNLVQNSTALQLLHKQSTPDDRFPV